MAEAFITRRGGGGAIRYAPLFTGMNTLVISDDGTSGYMEFYSSGTLSWAGGKLPSQFDLFCVGGGGGGGLCQATASGAMCGAGGGGGYTHTVTGASLPVSCEVAIGAGGAASADGGQTSIGNLCVAAGGKTPPYSTDSSGYVRGYSGRERVVYVMLSGKTQFLLFHVERRRFLYLVLSLLNVAYRANLLQFGERILYGLYVILFQLAADYRVVVPIDEGVVYRLVLQYAHLGVHVVLHTVVVAVEVVGRDVEQYGYVGAEVVHVVKLERAKLYDIVFVRVFGHLQGKAVAYVAGQPDIVARALEDVLDERSCRCLSVAAGNANHLGVCIASGKLYFADYADAFLRAFQHHRRVARYAGAFYYLVGVEDVGLRMPAFLPPDAVRVEHFLVLVLDCRHVGNKDIEALLLSQHSRSGSAFSRSEYYNSFHIFSGYGVVRL